MESWTEFRLPLYEHLYTYLNRRIGSDPFAPDVSFLTSDGAQVNGHLAVLKSCPCLYLKALFVTKKDKYPLDVGSGAFKAILLFIYKGEFDELDVGIISEIISAASPSTFDIPLVVEGYFKQLMDKRDWHLIYADVENDPIHLGIFFDHLKAKQPKFYESSKFNELEFEKVSKMCKSPPFSTKDEMTTALFKWAGFNNAGHLFNRIKDIVDSWEDPPPLILQNGVGAGVEIESGSSASTPASIQASTSPQSVQNHEESNNLENIENPEENISPILPPVRKSPRKSRGRPARMFAEGYNSFSRGSRTPESAPEAGSGPGPSTGRISRNGPSGPAIKKPRKEARGSKNLVNEGANGSAVHLTFDNARFLCFGKWENGDALRSYSLKSRLNKKLAPKPFIGLHQMALLSARDKIYCLGGAKGSNSLDFVKSIPIENLGQSKVQWNPGPQLLVERCLFQAHFYQNSIYLFGGCEGNEISNCIDYYNFETKMWKCHDYYLEYVRERYGSALLDNQFILAGGRGRRVGANGEIAVLDSVEAFNPHSGDGKILPSMKQKRSDLQLVTLGGKVYAIGGLDESGNKQLESMEIYTPAGRLGNKGKWVDGASMNYPRAKGSAFALDGKIYYAGGTSASVPTIEVYDPAEEAWTMVESDITEYADLSTVVVIPN